VHGRHGREGGQDVQAPLQLGRVERGELVHPRRDQEGLEADHPGVVQAAQLAGVAGHGPAPEGNVDVQLAVGGLALGLQGGHVGGGRDRVERHVDQGGDAAGGGGPGGAGEALPVRPAGLVDVHVAVDQPRQQDLVGGQGDGPPAGQPGGQRLHGGHAAVAHGHARGRLAGGRDRPRRPQDQLELAGHG
jgi:hypothetical protein